MHTESASTEIGQPALPHFRHISRYWDPQRQRIAAKLKPGDYYVTVSGELVATVLGSCVSVCVRDSKLGIGGMNHFMLPDAGSDSSAWADAANAATRYGAAAMEYLLNDILALGGKRERLECKLVGGGSVIAGMDTTRVGARNVEFVRHYARVERLCVLGEDLGGIYARKVIYSPTDGRLSVKRLRIGARDTLLTQEKDYSHQILASLARSNVEFF